VGPRALEAGDLPFAFEATGSPDREGLDQARDAVADLSAKWASPGREGADVSATVHAALRAEQVWGSPPRSFFAPIFAIRRLRYFGRLFGR